MPEEENGDEPADGQPGGLPSPQEKKNDSIMNMEDEKAIDYVLGNVKNSLTSKSSKALFDRQQGRTQIFF